MSELSPLLAMPVSPRLRGNVRLHVVAGPLAPHRNFPMRTSSLRPSTFRPPGPPPPGCSGASRVRSRRLPGRRGRARRRDRGGDSSCADIGATRSPPKLLQSLEEALPAVLNRFVRHASLRAPVRPARCSGGGAGRIPAPTQACHEAERMRASRRCGAEHSPFVRLPSRLPNCCRIASPGASHYSLAQTSCSVSKQNAPTIAARALTLAMTQTSIM